MNEQFFHQCETVEAVKKLYRTLAMQFHPDRGGDTATMQELNCQYQDALHTCDGQISIDSDESEHTYHYNAEREQALVEFLDRLIRSGALLADVECWLIGTWVWVMGNTKPVKEILKALNCKWHVKRSAWYWHADEHRHRYNGSVGLASIAAAYGASRVNGEQNESLAEALR
jgi:hypothetical protein